MKSHFSFPPISIPAFSQILESFSSWRDKRAFRNQRAFWYRDLARALDDGTALKAYLETAISREDEYGSKRIARCLAGILKRLPGRDLGGAMAGVVPPNDRMILSSADRAGKLAENLRFLAKTTQQVSRFEKALKAAVYSPLVPATISIGTLWYVAVYMLPMLSDMVPPEKMTGAAWLMAAVGIYIRDYGLFTLFLLVALVVAVMYYLPRWTGPNRRVADKTIFSLYRDFNAALWLSTYALLLKAGEAQREALEGIARQGTPWLRWHCNTMLSRMARFSDNPGAIYDTGLLPRDVTNRMLDLAKRGHAFAEIIEEISTSIFEDTEEKVTAVTNRLGVFVELFAGGLILLISLGTTALSSVS